MKFIWRKEQSLGKEWEIHNGLLLRNFVKPLESKKAIFKLRRGGGKISTQGRF
jgi:hypothetical protein